MRIRLTDNGKCQEPKDFKLESSLESFRNSLDCIDGKNLGILSEKNSKFLIYPPISKDVDLDENDIILDVDYSDKWKPRFSTGNVMGFMSLKDNVQVHITSRFDTDGKNFLLHYMLQKVCHVVFTPKTNTSEDFFYDFLYYLFPGFLNAALKQGIYHAYVNREYNDSNVKGPIDISRHLRYNIPFNGKVTYRTREYATDNCMTQLVRHTIEFIRTLSYGRNILNGGLDAKTRDSVKAIEQATLSYNRNLRQQIISKNLRPITHPYYTAYEPLRKLCVAILTHQKMSYGDSAKNQLSGILFDGASLWEEYLNVVLKENLKANFKHPNNRSRKNAQYLFRDDENHNRRWIFPDFIIENENVPIIMDAKYKMLDGDIGREDSFQMLAYLFRFRSKQGFLIYPEAHDKGVHQPKTLNLYSDISVKLTTLPLVIPKPQDSFENFRSLMEKAEKEMLKIL